MEADEFQFPPSDWQLNDDHQDAYNLDPDSQVMYDPSIYGFEDDFDSPERLPFLQSMRECAPPIVRSMLMFTMPLVLGGFVCSAFAALALRLLPRRPRLAYLLADLFNAGSGSIVFVSSFLILPYELW